MSILRKKKICIQCKKDKYIFSKGRCKECAALVSSAVKRTRKKEKKETVAQLKKKLDEIFSKFIRLRNADDNGMVECYTSGKIIHYKESHAGHFIVRSHLGTRWNEINVQVQSVEQNIYRSGNPQEFGRRIIQDYGIEEYEKLFELSKKTIKVDRFFYENMIAHYSSEVEKLKIKYE